MIRRLAERLLNAVLLLADLAFLFVFFIGLIASLLVLGRFLTGGVLAVLGVGSW